MKKREISTSGIFVSELGLGCMSLPLEFHEAKNIIDAALHAGINFFDTADLYDSGKNETIVGKALKERRNEIILATKVGNRRLPGKDGWQWDPSKAYIINAVKDSLLRLETDYIDLYQLHGGMIEDNVEESIDAFETLKQEGVIRQYGISSIRPNVIKRFLSNSSAISVMMQYSMLDRRPEEWFPMIQNAGASVLTRGTLAKGLLTTDGLRRLKQTDNFAEYDTAQLNKSVEEIHLNSEDIHATAIAFNLENQIVASSLIGASSTEQLLDSIIAYEKQINQKEMDSIVSSLKIHQYKEHRL